MLLSKVLSDYTVTRQLCAKSLDPNATSGGGGTNQIIKRKCTSVLFGKSGVLVLLRYSEAARPSHKGSIIMT